MLVIFLCNIRLLSFWLLILQLNLFSNIIVVEPDLAYKWSMTQTSKKRFETLKNAVDNKTIIFIAHGH
jgi:hypothetical protein